MWYIRIWYIIRTWYHTYLVHNTFPTKTKISRTHAHTHNFFGGDVAIRNSLRSNNVCTLVPFLLSTEFSCPYVLTTEAPCPSRCCSPTFSFPHPLFDLFDQGDVREGRAIGGPSADPPAQHGRRRSFGGGSSFCGGFPTDVRVVPIGMLDCSWAIALVLVFCCSFPTPQIRFRAVCPALKLG